MWSLSSPRLRLKYISLIWKTYLQVGVEEYIVLFEALYNNFRVYQCLALVRKLLRILNLHLTLNLRPLHNLDIGKEIQLKKSCLVMGGPNKSQGLRFINFSRVHRS